MALTVVLGITGSIGAYKAADLVRRLREQHCEVSCVLTKEAERFIAPLTLQAVSGRKIYDDLFSLEESHVIHTTLAEGANLLLIAPATANIIGKLANGLADDLLTCVALATKAPVLIAPAMNVQMYQHPIVQENIKRLRALRYHFVGPQFGPLVCGYEAVGHLAEVEDIVRAAMQMVAHPGARQAPSRGPGPARPTPSTSRAKPAAKRLAAQKRRSRR